MTPGAALRRAGARLRGARILCRLHAGPVKTVWLLGRGDERWVMRVDEPPAAGFAPDRGIEFEVWQAAAAAGLAPQPLWLHRGPPAVLVAQHAAGRAWRAADLALPGRLEALAALLRRVHQARLPGPPLDLGRAMAAHARRIGTPRARELARSARLWLDRAGSPGPPVLCHNDPIAANVVGLRRTVLIDWEYAARGDPLFDLAVIAQHHALPGAQVARLAAAYHGGVGQVPQARLAANRVLYDHVLWLWLMALAVAAPLRGAQARQLAAVTRRLEEVR